MKALVVQLPSSVPMRTACTALGLCRAGIYRERKPHQVAPLLPRKASPRRLADVERHKVLNYLHSEEFMDQAPREIYATLLSRGIYLASTRTMYRILADSNESRERRAQRQPQKHTKPVLEASRPNQVWTWDITKLCGPKPGIFYNAYVIIDLYSRYVVGWLVAEHESKELAKALFAETLMRRNIGADTLTIHSDRGAPMTSDTMASLFSKLGIERSLSRPRVSNDNAYSESQFRTLKYQADYPMRFASLYHAKAWLEKFFAWYNNEHHHVGLELFTPSDVYRGEVEAVAHTRQTALDSAYSAHPERFVKGKAIVKLPPTVVYINPPLGVLDDKEAKQKLAS